MNYLEMQTYQNEYHLTLNNGFVLQPYANYLFDDGSIILDLLNGMNRYYKFFNFRLNNVFKNNPTKKLVAVAVPHGDSSELDIFVPSYYDFITIYNQGNAHGTVFEVEANQVSNLKDDDPSFSYHVDDYLNIGIGGFDQFTYFEDYDYTIYETDLDGAGSCVYDFTNIYNDTLWYSKHGLGLHTHFLTIRCSDYLNIGVGQPYAEIRDNAYNEGYSNGYTTGIDEGYNNGFNDGFASNAEQRTSDAFDYIGHAFLAVNNVLALEVLPHITLGLCFSIPLTIVLCMTIFKLIKK